jgi:hypothetical protein
MNLTMKPLAVSRGGFQKVVNKKVVSKLTTPY